MKRIAVFIAACIAFTTPVFAQALPPLFEGEVVYNVSYKTKNPKLNEKQLTGMLGSIHRYYHRAGDYKTVTNAGFALWQLYINKDNKIYSKTVASDTVFWNDAAVHYDEVLDVKLTKNATTILGYPCDELIMKFRSGTHTYYFNTTLRLDAKLFEKHAYGNFYNFVSRSNAVPLKMIVEDGDIIMHSVAAEVTPKKLEATFFVLPPGTKTAKSLY